MQQAEPAILAWRTLLAIAIVLPATVLFGESVIQACLPAMRAVITWLAPDFVVENLSIAGLNADRVLRLDIANRHHLHLGKHLVAPGRSINATINILAPLVPVVTALVTALAWPDRWPRVLLRLPVLALLLPPVLLADAPLVLVALTWDFWQYAANPGDTSAWTLWMQFLTRGGRPALGIACGLLAILLTQHYASRMSRSAHTQPPGMTN